MVCAQENAVNGDHVWMETSCSGELCYLGEDNCPLKAAVSGAHAAVTVIAAALNATSALPHVTGVKSTCERRLCDVITAVLTTFCVCVCVFLLP